MSRGFSLIESLVALGLTAIMIPALIAGYAFALKTAVQGESFSQAYALAQEGMEITLELKQRGDSAWNWTGTPLYTGVDEVYQPALVAGDWQLGGKTSSPVMDFAPFTRTVTIKEVYRCGIEICLDHQVEAWMSPEIESRFITVAVNWLEAGQSQKVELKTYVTLH